MAALPTPSIRLRSYAILAVVMLLWSGNLIVGRAVRGDIPPFTLALIRWTGAALIVLPFAWRHLAADRAALVAGWRPLLLLGLTGVAAFNALVYSGLRYTTAINGLLLLAAIPATVLVFDRLLFGLRTGPMQIGGVVISTLGVLYIILRGAPLAILSLGFNGGDLSILIAILCWAAYTSLLRLRPDCDPASFLLVTFAIGIIAMAPLTLTELDRIAVMTLNWQVVSAILYVAILPSVVAYFLYNKAVRDIGAGPAGQTISLMPLFGSLLAATLLGEPLHASHVTGMAAIVAGIVIVAIGGRIGSRDQS